MGKGCVASAEIVKGNHNPVVLKRPDRPCHGICLTTQECCFQQFQLEPVGSEGEFAQKPEDALNQAVSLPQLALGHIDIEARHRLGRIGPCTHLPKAPGQYEVPDLCGQRSVLQGRLKGGRREQSAARVPPAHQRLQPAHNARAQIDDRLIKYLELAARQRCAHIGQQPKPVLGNCAKTAAKHASLAAAVRFRLIKRNIGVLEKLVGRHTALRIVGGSQTDSDIEATGGGFDGRLEQAKKRCHAAGYRGPAGQARQDDCELIATDPSNGVTGANAAGKPPGEFNEQLIAYGVPMTIVDAFEVVNVEHHQCQAGTVGYFNGIFEATMERAPIRDSGQCVVVRHTP